jgi:diguanylate cyclase (GGDEF)-like protein
LPESSPIARSLDPLEASFGAAARLAARPLTGGELGWIVRDLAARVGAEAGVLVAFDPSHHLVRVVYAFGAHEGARLPLTGTADGRGFVGRVLEGGRAAAEYLDPADDQSLGLAASGEPVTFALGAPVRPPGGPPGALCIGYVSPPPDEELALKGWLVGHYASLAAMCQYDGGVLQGLLIAARTDGLTGCLNHAALRTELHRELERSTRSGRPVSCCFIDLDRFKQINDTYGHPHGSRVLAEVSTILRQGMRVGDTLGRYGGDEFVAILPDTTRRAAVALAERLRATISSTTPQGEHDPLSVSIGVAQVQPGDTADALLAAADDALLTAKGAGGGLVVGASDAAARGRRGVAANLRAPGPPGGRGGRWGAPRPSRSR